MPEFRTNLPNARVTPRSPACHLLPLPLLDAVEPQPARWTGALYGARSIPASPSPARFGPCHPRRLAVRQAYHIEHDVNLAEVFSLADAGDAPVQPFDCETNAEVIASFARAIGDPKHTKLFAIGGDHSIALPNMRATWERRGKPKGGLALIHFDSHVDTVDQTLGERYSHASPFIRAIEEGILDPKRMLTIGVKGPLNTKDDLRYAQEKGVTLVTYERWRREGDAPIREFLTRLGDDEAYLSFDIDVVDPAFAPGTGTPSMGGFTSAEVLALLRGLVGVNLVGADLVEVLPDRDVSQITALLASQIITEVLALDAVRATKRG